jgi:hypothetical protein
LISWHPTVAMIYGHNLQKKKQKYVIPKSIIKVTYL